ncbi:MAG: AAA family ATPase [Anaerolineae bacterium]|nr:AAA family ATPase [Anaerolineae bacterium]
MSTPILATKLYIPPSRLDIVRRPRLIERLNEGRKLTLISAPAGFGKTTLLSSWVNQKDESREAGMKDEVKKFQPSVFSLQPSQVAWLSLDKGDNDHARFLAYLVAALQTIAPTIGAGVLASLQAPQPPPVEAILTTLLNEIAASHDPFLLILDDYHVIEAQPVDQALTFLLAHLPPQMHLVIATREDPHLPLARLRARSQLTELRAADLRFTPAEAAEFLNRVMSLNLSTEEIAALDARTEGWIAGLQLAALSMQGQPDAAGFIQSFTGSHHFVLDYLVEEVLHRQPESVQMFLLRTSILDRLCGPLCDAVLGKDEGGRMKDEKETNFGSSALSLQPSSFILEYLERANLFIVPLDNERRWYRYHHLFADLLRQRLRQNDAASHPGGDIEGGIVAEYHIRASQWYEDNGLELEAFHHAVAAHDIERTERLIEGKGMPLHFRGAMAPVLRWLESLPAAVLDARPSLWVTYASALMMSGHPSDVESKLQAAEAALRAQQAQRNAQDDDKTRDLIGQIAAIRALAAAAQNDVKTSITLSHRALEYLHPDNLAVRTVTTLTLGVAYEFQGDRAAARQAYNDVISIGQASGNFMLTIAAASSLGQIQEAENQLYLAAKTYQRILQMVGDPAQWTASVAHFGLARIFYEWNDLEAAERHGQLHIQLAPQIECDTSVSCEVLLARLKLAQGDVGGAGAMLAQAEQSARQHNFANRITEVITAQVLMLLHQGDVASAAHLAEKHSLPLSRARVYLAQGNPAAALAVLEPWRRQVEAKSWQDECLKAMVLQAVALHAHGQENKAAQLVGDALALAEPGGFIRLFVDEGSPMAELLTRLKDKGGRMNEYIHKLLTAFGQQEKMQPSSFRLQPLIEPLSQRELEILQLIAQGLSNSEISERLFLALDTVKGHNRRIFGKLQVQRRTEAVAKARSLNILPRSN